MPSQYDKIGKRYASMQDMPADAPNIPSVLRVLPNVKGLNCLDLACGLGRYSRLLVEHGAQRVVGIDLSDGMINAAKELATDLPPEQRERLEFRTGDCSKPINIEGGPFDLIIAAWLLNYAPDYESMLSTWQNIYLNLKPGGQLIAIVPKLNMSMETPLDDRYGVIVEAIEKVKDGWKCRLTAYTDPPISFEPYHLSGEVYERSAREAGMVDLQLHSHVFPEDERKYSGFWDVYNERPHFEIMMARRPEV
ncbi:S-adenosyl-L-methionine-dependent methyltransferase [Rhizodiscina lignyota]|uniref:S-adenosyl-L-methionine-dependent methyltransferase n=1 Tax=Rhizodiscina lignyota TaxID=1504668 RepID=A0A9P4M3V3_9PEZI|nr:S-adenosyl-L-methionine-dependent methyltransferase [Rhizodiscina lignyota]